MAVTVLPERDERHVKRVSCGNCAARLEYTKSDVDAVHGRDYGGGPDGHEFIRCPKCGGKAIIRSW